MRYGLVTAAVAALAVATAASVLVLDRPSDQAGRKLDESPLYIVGAQTTPVPDPTTAVGLLPNVPVTTAPGVGPGASGDGVSITDASGPEATPAQPPAGTASPASPRGDAPSPVAVAPAPAQTVPPADNGKHNGAGKGAGKGDTSVAP